MKLSDIPPFQGDGSQDADKWQQDFLANTAHYSDEAVARLFISKLAIGYPAHTLIDSLSDSVKTSWFKLERVFRTEWLANRKIDPPKQDPWEAFERHILTEEMIFGDSNNGGSTSTPSEVIMVWVDEHLRLGRNTGGTDECLVRMTKLLLPIFIRMVLSSKPKSESFSDICATIRQVPHDVLEMEKSRYRETSQKAEQLTTTARRLEEIARRIEELLKVANTSLKAPLSDHSLTNEVAPGPQSLHIVLKTPPAKHNLISTNPASSASKPTLGSIEEKYPISPEPSLRKKTTVHAVNNVAPTNIGNNQKDGNPETWELRKPDILIPKSEQLDIAQKAIDIMLQNLKGSYVFSGLNGDQYQHVWSALSIHDGMMCSSIYKSKVGVALSRYCSPDISGSKWPDPQKLLWGISLLHGFQTYGNSKFLEVAKHHWNAMKSIFIAKDQATAKRYTDSCHDDIHLHKNREGDTSLTGGVFNNRFSGSEIAALETTLFMCLSAHLSKCTGEANYMDTAVLSANCIKTHMMDPDSFVVKDSTVDAWNGKITKSGTPSRFLTGVFLEGLSILASASGDKTWRQLSLRVANASMKMGQWHKRGWILSTATGYFGPGSAATNSNEILIRGLRYVWKQDSQDLVSRSSIQRYINVQYNALLDFARTGDSYSNIWTESKTRPVPSAAGQLAALDLVSAVIEVNQS
ncbi:hypothetical protein FRC03_002990 [Tulasnella sp. 419]|nr:hypothetical protein FRC03_002990 [Tulasnella sp. 419]